MSNMVRETNIKCPICGAFIFCDESSAYLSSPIQHKYYCPDCGEFSHVTFSDEALINYIKKNFAISEDSAKKKEERDYHAKQDCGKAKLTLVPRRILWDIATIREYGNNKYPEGGSDNWKTVEVDRYRDAAYRHFMLYLDDPHGVDEESGLPHLWHLACNIAFLCEKEDEFLSERTPVSKKIKYPYSTAEPQVVWTNYIPEACRSCSNHPANGGSGNCNCTLGSLKVTSTSKDCAWKGNK